MRFLHHLNVFTLFFTIQQTSMKRLNLKGEGTYIALSPKALRPGLPFTISLNILKPGKNYMAEMEIRNSQNRTLANAMKKNVKSGKPIILRIKEVFTKEFQNHSQKYYVYIRGRTAKGNVIFEDKQKLLFVPKSVSIFVQTDKAAYIPGSEVKFRAIVVKPDLKPYQGTINVKIFDPKDNIVKHWINSSLNTGVFAQFLNLTTDPPLGDWTIFVETKNGERFDTRFSVEKYVLPKFDVTLDVPKMAIMKEDVVVTVKAMYTFGKGVAGSVRLIACNTLNDDCIQDYEIDSITEKTKHTDKHGQATFRFTKREHKKFSKDYERYKVKFVATVTEDLTGIERTGKGAILIHKYEVYLKITPLRGKLISGLPYKFLIAIKQQDGTPIEKPYPRNVKLMIYHDAPYNDKRTEKRRVRLDRDGTKVVEIVPMAGTKYYHIEVSYDPSGKESYDKITKYTTSDEITDYVTVSGRKSPTNTYIELLSTKEVVKAGENVKFQIFSTEKKLKFGTIQVMSRGNTVMTKQFSMPGKSRFIEFPTTMEMTPKSHLVIYALAENSKEILADAIDFQVTGFLQNKVKLSVNKKNAKPGERVKINVKTHPESFVALAAIDQSVLLLKDTNNDITTEKIEKDVERYGTTCYDMRYSCTEPPRQRTDAYTTFEECGLVVLTDAYIHKVKHYIPMSINWERDPDQYDGEYEEYVFSQYSYDYNTEKTSKDKPTLRTRFPETWIWTDSMTGSDGKVSFTATVPDTITSWAIDAFVIDESAGLALPSYSAKLQVFQPFFIRMNLPYAIKRGEKIGLQVLVFNYLPSDQSVAVTLKHGQKSGFDFIKKSGRIQKNGNKHYNVRSVKVPGNGGTSAVFFPIVATKINEITLHVKAIGNTASDAVQKSLIVESEGFRIERNVPVLIQLSSTNSFKKSVNFKFPSGAVADTQKTQVTLTGDIMAPILHNIKDLVIMPHGCGEQNMIGFVPNIVVMRYLKATNRLTEQIEFEAIQNMEAGYQQELTFQHADNSYSCFGEEDDSGSTWLTAFVVRSFKQAEPYIFIDKEKIKKSLQYLSNHQKKNGEFVENGEVYQKEMKGGASRGGVPMTAYVLATLLENGLEDMKSPIQFKAKGKGVAFAQVQYSYYMTKMHHGQAFDCDKSVVQKKDDEVMVGICCRHKKGGKSSMAVMEVESLSGYSFTAENINELTNMPKIQRVELEKGDTKTNLYFKSLDKKRTCVNITSKRLFPISEQKESQVVLYDYYEPSERVEFSYSVDAKSLSQVCPHCWDGVLEEESHSSRSGKCKNTARQCRRLKLAFCSRKDSLGQWMRKRCQKLCKRCN